MLNRCIVVNTLIAKLLTFVVGLLKFLLFFSLFMLFADAIKVSWWPQALISTITLTNARLLKMHDLLMPTYNQPNQSAPFPDAGCLPHIVYNAKMQKKNPSSKL